MALPAEPRQLTAACLFDGYGGFELGMRLAGLDVRTVVRVERDSHAAATLVARMAETHLDQAPIWDDVTTFDGRPWAGRVDIITAGFNCQPFSSAGHQRGVNDERWLWPDIARIIDDVGPRFVFLENVTGLVRAGLPYICADLADLGFDAEWGCLSAAAVGAPHRRERFWLLASLAGEDVADASGVRRTGSGQQPQSHGWASTHRCYPPRPDDADGWERWITEGGPQPQIRRSTHGRPVGLAEQLHLGGNGLVPRVAAEALAQLVARAGIGRVT